MKSVYIADISVRMIPSNPRSRLKHIIDDLKRYPVVINEDMSVDHTMMMNQIRRMYRDRDMSKYNVTYKISNLKFSTKCQWAK